MQFPHLSQDIIFCCSLNDDNAGQIILDWTQDILYPNMNTKDLPAFQDKLNQDVFAAESISFYTYSSELPYSSYRVINEINVYGR